MLDIVSTSAGNDFAHESQSPPLAQTNYLSPSLFFSRVPPFSESSRRADGHPSNLSIGLSYDFCLGHSFVRIPSLMSVYKWVLQPIFFVYVHKKSELYPLSYSVIQLLAWRCRSIIYRRENYATRKNSKIELESGELPTST